MSTIISPNHPTIPTSSVKYCIKLGMELVGRSRLFRSVRYCILPSAVWCSAVHTFSHTPSPALLFFPSTLSLFSNPQHELVLPVTLIYKVLCRPTFTSIWLPRPMTSDFKQLVHREITPVQYQLSAKLSMLQYTLPEHAKSSNLVHTSLTSLAWALAVRIGDKYQIRLTQPIWNCLTYHFSLQHLVI